MKWKIELHEDFALEYHELPHAVQLKLIAHIKLLGEYGTALGRPKVDTLKASQHSNMKELRFDADNGVWRVAFAFDKSRTGIILVGADKKGANQQRFYKSFIKVADSRFSEHLNNTEANKS